MGYGWSKKVMLAGLMLAVLAGEAQAETARAPADGSPALVIEAPEGWQTGAMGPFTTISKAGTATRLAFAVESRPNIVAMPPQVVALSLLPPGASVTPAGTARIGAVSGDAFKLNEPDGRIVLSRLDAQHLAVIIEITPASGDPADRAALRKAEEGLRLGR